MSQLFCGECGATLDETADWQCPECNEECEHPVIERIAVEAPEGGGFASIRLCRDCGADIDE